MVNQQGIYKIRTKQCEVIKFDEFDDFESVVHDFQIHFDSRATVTLSSPYAAPSKGAFLFNHVRRCWRKPTKI